MADSTSVRDRVCIPQGPNPFLPRPLGEGWGEGVYESLPY